MCGMCVCVCTEKSQVCVPEARAQVLKHVNAEEQSVGQKMAYYQTGEGSHAHVAA